MHLNSNIRTRGEFPIDQPIEALKADHHLIRQMFDRYFHVQDINEKRDAGQHVLLLLEMHTSLEEAVFYPRVHEINPSLVDRCEEEHEHAKQLIEQLKIMDEIDVQTEQMFRKLANEIFSHVDTEEKQLFPKILEGNLDMSAIGQEMQEFEISMIAQRGQRPEAPGMRQ
jgi:hemerythrin superfamily protein